VEDLDITENHKFLGRQALYTSRTDEQINADTIPDIINGVMDRHLKNRNETIYLQKYMRGDHPILRRIRKFNKDINNKLVVNNAFSIVRNSVGYFLGEPIQFTARKKEIEENVQKLNDYMDSENKSLEDMSIGNDAAICGRGFRLVAVDDVEYEDDAPFEIPTLAPENTEVIYSTRAGHRPMLAFTHAPILDDSGNERATEWTVYDGEFRYIYVVPGALGTHLERKHLSSEPVAHFLPGVPIVEYLNNEWRIGDFEIVLSLLDAIDKLHSDRMNSVEQLVNSILVFVNCDLKSKEQNQALGKGAVSDLDMLKENLALSIQSMAGQEADVKFISSSVQQSDAEILAQTLMDYVYAISGIPDREERPGGGQDTGDAVYLRDGYQSLEIVARVKERNFRKADRQTLRMICEILRRFNNIDLLPMDIDIKFIRNRTNNLLNKSQAISNFISTHIMHPEDAISLAGLTNDPKGMAERGMEYWSTQEAQAASEDASYSTLGEGDDPDDTTDGVE
jgi:SPP1 family phage portal protein